MRGLTRIVERSTALVMLTAMVACASPKRRDAASADPTEARAADAAPVAVPVDPVALATELEGRGLKALTSGGLDGLFGAPGNVVYSPLGVGLTIVTADALLASQPERARRFTPLTSSVTACFSDVYFGQQLVFPTDIATTREAKEVAWILTPGWHWGQKEAAGAEDCARVSIPLQTTTEPPTIRDLLQPEEVPKYGGLAVGGSRLARSSVSAAVIFAKYREVDAAFRSCRKHEERSAEKALLETGPSVDLSRPLDKQPSPPPGFDVSANAHVERLGSQTIVVLPLRTVGSRSRFRQQSLALVLSDDPCARVPQRFEQRLVDRVREAARAPRDTAVRVVLPAITTQTMLVAAAPAPLDGLLASARALMPVASDHATGPSPDRARQPVPSGTMRIVVDRPFLYAVVDDATGVALLLGRFEDLDVLTRPFVPAAPTGGGNGATLRTGGGAGTTRP